MTVMPAFALEPSSEMATVWTRVKEGYHKSEANISEFMLRGLLANTDYAHRLGLVNFSDSGEAVPYKFDNGHYIFDQAFVLSLNDKERVAYISSKIGRVTEPSTQSSVLFVAAVAINSLIRQAFTVQYDSHSFKFLFAVNAIAVAIAGIYEGYQWLKSNWDKNGDILAMVTTDAETLRNVYRQESQYLGNALSKTKMAEIERLTTRLEPREITI